MSALDDGLDTLEWHGRTYTLGSQLGRGSFGKVWAALEIDRGASRGVVVKISEIIPGSAKSVEAQRQRLELEGRVAHQASACPSLVTAFDHGWLHEARRRSYVLVMERWWRDEGGQPGGQNLDEWLRLQRRDRGGVDPEHVRWIALQLAEALRFLHTRQPEIYIHRDVKPLNVLVLDRAGHAPDVRLADFGSVRAVGQEGRALVETVGPPPLTYDYAPAEVLAAIDRELPPPYSDATDFYALGVLLWECVTGRRWFGETEGRRRAGDWAGEGHPPLQSEWPQCTARPFDRALAETIDALLVTDPARRLRGDAALEKIRRLVRVAPQSALPATHDGSPDTGTQPPTESGPPTPRPERPTTAEGPAISVESAQIVASRPVNAPVPPPPAPNSRRQRRQLTPWLAAALLVAAGLVWAHEAGWLIPPSPSNPRPAPAPVAHEPPEPEARTSAAPPETAAPTVPASPETAVSTVPTPTPPPRVDETDPPAVEAPTVARRPKASRPANAAKPTVRKASPPAPVAQPTQPTELPIDVPAPDPTAGPPDAPADPSPVPAAPQSASESEGGGFAGIRARYDARRRSIRAGTQDRRRAMKRDFARSKEGARP